MLGVTRKAVDDLWCLARAGKVAAKEITLGELMTHRGMYFLHAQWGVTCACYVLSEDDCNFECVDLVDGQMPEMYSDTTVFVISEAVAIAHLIATQPAQKALAEARVDKNPILFL